VTIRLRRVTIDDGECLYRWRVDNNEYFFGAPPTPENHKRWLEAVIYDDSQRAFIIILDTEPIGTISLYNIDWLHRRAEYGRFIIEEAARGNGYGRAALEAALHYAFKTPLSLNRIYANILYDNRAGLAVARSCGFHPEGVLWEHVRQNGVYRDVVHVALLRDEWYIRAGS
jgi:RimJ/RimL family protein N-acetyltransferase